MQEPHVGAQPPTPEGPAPRKLITPGRVIALLGSAIGLYVVWPSLVAVLASAGDLDEIRWPWFFVIGGLEAASYGCMWLLIGLALASRRWYLIGTSQVAGNAFSKAVPGGSAAGAALQYRMLSDGGIPAPKIATGLTAVSLINVATLFAMPLFALPAILGGAAINDGLARAAWLGLGAFVFLFAGGAALLLADKPVHLAARAAQKLHNTFLRHRPPITDLTERLTRERDTVRSILGKRWAGAIVRSIGNVALDYGALLAALVAVGAKPRPSLVLLAYVAAVVIAMFPITPGGLGLVEAGLAGMLVLAGVNGAQATLATLAYRLASYWGPLLAGVIAYYLYRRRAPKWRARAAAAAEGVGP
jgi:uncharacterized protein (TIRG00374 family)